MSIDVRSLRTAILNTYFQIIARTVKLFLCYEIGKIFALIVGLYYLTQLTRSYKLVLLLLPVAIFCETYGLYIAVHHRDNAWLFNFYLIIEVWLMGLAALFFVRNKNVQGIFLLLLIIETLIWTVNLYVNTIYQFANYSMISGCILLTIMYIAVLLNNSIFSNKSILKQPVFWLSASSILYFACDIPYMGMHNFLSKYLQPSAAVKLQLINSILDIIRYPMIGISFILLGRQKQPELKTV